MFQVERSYVLKKKKSKTHLFHHSSRFELVAVRQAADEAPLALSVDPQPRGLPTGAAESLALRLGTASTGTGTNTDTDTSTGTGTSTSTAASTADTAAVREAGLIAALVDVVARAPMARATFLGLAVEEKVSEDPARTPKEAVGPTLDAALVLVKDEHGAGGDHLALRVDEAPGDAWDHSSACGLEDEQGVARGLYPAGPRGLGPCGGRTLGVAMGVRRR